MQDPNEDTEWNDILRGKGILPPKEKEISEQDIINMCENTIAEKTKDSKDISVRTLDELDELEDEEDERVLLQYRNKRIAELKALAAKALYGHVIEITKQDYVQQVNKAGPDVWVVLHLYEQGVPLCKLVNQHLALLAEKFKGTKFIKSIATTCIPNFDHRSLPTILVYYEDELKSQFVGPSDLRDDLTVEELEWMLGKVGAVSTDIKENPRAKIKDVLFEQLQSDNNDW